MRVALHAFILFLFLPMLTLGVAQSGDLIRVAREECRNDRCAEWRLKGVPGIVFSIASIEGGPGESFDRVDRDGKFVDTILTVFSVVRDSKRRDWGGDRERIKSMPFKTGAKDIIVWATFDHEIARFPDTDYGAPHWQMRIPAVLFNGEVSPAPGELPSESCKFRPISLADLVAQAKRPDARSPSRPTCSGLCCPKNKRGPE
jgi:hypothetical protein